MMDLPPATFTASLISTTETETGDTRTTSSGGTVTVTRKRSKRPSTADSPRQVFSSAVSSFANFSPGGMSIMSPASASMSAWSNSVKAPTMSVSSFASESTTASSFVQHEIVIPDPVPVKRRRRTHPDRLLMDKRKKKHHAYGSVVPYPCSYEPFVLDHQVLDVEWNQMLCNSVSHHVWDPVTEPNGPRKVLDLGCGTGSWILSAAKEWKDAEFIGFDLVPIQPPLQSLDQALQPELPTSSASSPTGRPSLDALLSPLSSPPGLDSASSSTSSVNTSTRMEDRGLRDRIRWVHGDFLEVFPFDDGEFDLVHIRRIARGVPENKWDHIFSECARVMKPGGRLEIIECNLNFPASDFKHWSAAFNLDPHPSSNSPSPSPYSPSPSLPRRSIVGALRSTTVKSSSFDSPGPMLRHTSSAVHLPSPSPPRSSLHAAPIPRPPDPRDHSLLEGIYTSLHESRFVNLNPLSLVQSHLVLHFDKVATHPPLMMLAPPRRGDPVPVLPGLKAGGTPTTGIINAMDLNAWASKVMGSLAKVGDAGKGVQLPPSVPKSMPGDEVLSLEQIVARNQSLEISPKTSSEHGVTSTPEERPYRVEDFIASSRSRHPGNITLKVGNQTIQTMNSIPNRRFNYDVHHSGLHLSIAVADVLGCVEDMWGHLRSLDPEADRHAFDELVERYAADVRSRVGLTDTLEKRLGWKGKRGKGVNKGRFDEQLERALEDAKLTEDLERGASSINSLVGGMGEGVNGQESHTGASGRMVSRTWRAWCVHKPM